MDKDILLASGGRSDWRIVLREDAPKLDKLAASELEAHIRKVCGASLPIVTASEPASPHEISVGGARPLPGFVRGDNPNDEDFRYVVTPERVWIAGSGLRGTLYGAFAFLEDELGVRWFTKDVAYVPKREELYVKSADVRDAPAIHLRRQPYKCAGNYAFGVRNRLNELGGFEDEPEFGSAVYPFALGHSIHLMVPDELYAEHPEYFPLIEGHRENGAYHQRCLTNPDVLRLTIERVRETLRAHPSQRTIAVGQADTYPDAPNNCHCPACRAIDEAEGTPMGSLLRFVNAVAEATEDEFPNVLINTLAYRYTRKPPRVTKPRKNVMVVLCSIECCFSHPLDSNCGANYMDGPIGHVSNDAFLEDIDGWAAICDKLYIWDYVTNFPRYLTPHPNLRAIAPNMRSFLRHHAYGVYPEGAHDCANAELDELRSYLLARLMWQPARDERRDMMEFLIGCLGVAAAPMIEYIDLLHDRVMRDNIHMSTYAPPSKALFSPEVVARADALFDRAETLAPDERALAMVRTMRMGIRYVKLCLYDVERPEPERRTIAADFLADAEALDIATLSEGATRADAPSHVAKLLRL